MTGRMNMAEPEIRFQIDRSGPRPESWLTINGQSIRFMGLTVETVPGDLPKVTISVYARLLGGTIKGAKGEIQIIHVDESTKGLIGPDEEVRRKGWIGPGARPDGCEAT